MIHLFMSFYSILASRTQGAQPATFFHAKSDFSSQKNSKYLPANSMITSHSMFHKRTFLDFFTQSFFVGSHEGAQTSRYIGGFGSSRLLEASSHLPNSVCPQVCPLPLRKKTVEIGGLSLAYGTRLSTRPVLIIQGQKKKRVKWYILFEFKYQV